MALIAKSGTPSVVQLGIPTTNKYANMIAGEELFAGDALFVQDADGRVYKSKDNCGSSSSSSTDEGSRVDGYAAVQTKVGEAVTVFFDVVWAYAAVTQTPGIPLYLSCDVNGGLDTVKSKSDSKQIGLTLTNGRIHLKQSWP